ncbi:hypothetical protein ACLOJK_030028 [Asimina triloba]
MIALSTAGSTDLNKKRKLQEGQLGLPLSKHRFRDRSCQCPDDPQITDNEEETDNEDGARLEQCESVWDSNSFVGEYDTGMAVDDTEARCKYEMRLTKAQGYYKPATSSGSCSINNRYNTVTCPASSSPTNSREHVLQSDEDLNHLNLVTAISEDHLAGFGMTYADYMCKDQGNISKEQPLDMASLDETMLYPNGVEPNIYLLSSGRWSVNQDARLGARKPTIDQEFEQYFSMLML